MKFLALDNLSSTKISEKDPREAEQRPEFTTKEEFRAWCNDIKTNHCFFNHTEGCVPSLRITADSEGELANPPMYLHGFTADFDTEMDLAAAIKQVTRNANAGRLPMFASQTFSGGVRLTWEFEERVFVDNADITQRFMEELVRDLGCKALLAGFDVNSLKLTQYYEAGSNWTEIPDAKSISGREIGVLFYRAASSIKIHGERTIPLEAVEEEVMKRWGARVKSLKEGDRVPLFWVEPFVDRVGSQVGQFGMICYSDRAGKSFVSWGDILGREFAGQYEAKRIGEAVEMFCWNGKHYFLVDDFIQVNKDDAVMHMKVLGVSNRPAKNKLASEAEEVLTAIQRTNRVVAAVPLVHNKNRYVEIKGERVLNISRTKLLPPADSGNPEKWPFLHDWFWKIWDAPHELQRDVWLHMMKYRYTNCLKGEPKPGQAAFIAGPTGVGKTLYNLRILGGIFGKTSDAAQFLLGKTNFNKENVESYVWAIDDNQGATHFEQREALASNIKKYVANPEVRCEAKGADSYVIPWTGIISVTCNQDVRSLQVIPSLDSTTEGKINLFKWRNGENAPDFGAYGSRETQIAEELPYFCKFLLEWEPPASVVGLGRYAVSEFHHPEILQKVQSGAPKALLMEIIDNLLENEPAKEDTWANLRQITEYLHSVPSARRLMETEFGKQRLHMALEEAGYARRWRGNSPQFKLVASAHIGEFSTEQ